ncbi:hypothetical protein F4818DRAFT_431220 [Hypoxylon cercidicola]|nr:hypothetical protein F4818DRAFT_431220 [Hypoxylon cercidicola]
MGRKPNPIIIEYFERGAKLPGNSNRYRHRCKLCGEEFPKGRIESLTTHLIRKCPAISVEDREHAFCELNDIPRGASRMRFDGLLHTGPNAGPPPAPVQNQGQNQGQNQNQIWTPLEALAEASRQIEANEKHDDHVPSSQDHTAEAIRTTLAAAVPVAASTNPFELHEQFTLENPPMNVDNRSQHGNEENPPMDFDHHSQNNEEYQPTNFDNRPQDDEDGLAKPSDIAQTELSAEDTIRQLLPNAGSPQSVLSVAAAATARLNTSLLHPQFLPGAISESAPQPQPQSQSTDMMIEYPLTHEQQLAPPSTNVSTLPWDSTTYLTGGIHAPATVNDHGQRPAITLNRGGFRMDTSNGLYGTHQRHNRSKFEPDRRKEVSAVRLIGACIRCRILRKTCSLGTPCVTCKKVLSPRVWNTGCVRIKQADLDKLYSAKVQAVLSQKRINSLKSSYRFQNVGITVEASHFPETGHKATFQVLQGTQNEGDDNLADASDSGRVLLLDYDNEEIESKVETYMRETLNELISREPSHYVKVTLETATTVANNTNDELLKRSLQLWGIVEMIDRERQWTMLAKSPKEDVEDYWIKDDSDSEAYTNICMQLTAAAERKADAASRTLLKGILQNLLDAKIKLGFPMFLTVMLYLNCMEKTTWAFKAWDQEKLRPLWPLQNPPSSYTDKGDELTGMLRTLLVNRKVLPAMISKAANLPIEVVEEDDTVKEYFQHLGVTPAYLRTRLELGNFQPTDSRSLEFLFCAPLLLQN